MLWELWLFVFKQKTAYEMRISDWSSDVCSSDLLLDELASYVDNEELIYCHNWRPGDLLIWDNRALQHARMNFDPAQKRTIRRDRKSVVYGKSGSVRVDRGGRRIIKNKYATANASHLRLLDQVTYCTDQQS